MKLCLNLSRIAIKHILSILISMFMKEYSGKTIDFAKFSENHRNTIGGVKDNRIIYPLGIRQNIKQFAISLQKTDIAVRLVIVGNRQYYVYHYEGKLNKQDNAVILITYPKDKFHDTKAFRTFICTNSVFTTEEILKSYYNRWQIEVYFRNYKNKLAFDKCQIRTKQVVHRFWLIISLAYYICCMNAGQFVPFDEGYHNLQSQIQRQYITFVYTCGAKHLHLNNLLSFTA